MATATPRAGDDIDGLLVDLAEVLEARIDGRAWRRRSSCGASDVDPAVFLPSRHTPKSAEIAKAVCDSCPVQAPCLEEALALPARRDMGVRAGMSPRERNRIRAERRRLRESAAS